MHPALEWWTRHHDSDTKAIWLSDHFGSFDYTFRNYYLDLVPNDYTVYSEYWFPDEVHRAYPQLKLKFSAWLWLTGNSIFTISETASQVDSPTAPIQNFLSSFFRSNQPERHAILAKIYQHGWFDPQFCSKHFVIDSEQCARYNIDYATLDKDFVQNITRHDFFAPTDHTQNLLALSPLIQKSFINLVVETKSLGTTVCFPTEKFLYAVANRRLWLAVAPPNYHKMINQQFGFKLYSCFDYGFDARWEDLDRLTLLLGQFEKFANFSSEQWQQVYDKEQATLEYNYQRLVSLSFFDDIARIDQDNTGLDSRIDSRCPERIRFLASKTAACP